MGGKQQLLLSQACELDRSSSDEDKTPEGPGWWVLGDVVFIAKVGKIGIRRLESFDRRNEM